MNTSNFENLIMPSEILFNKDLTDREKMLLSIILSLSRKSNFCYAGNDYISDIFNVSAGTISRDISSLRNKKYIDEIFDDKAKNSRKRKIIPIKENIFKHSQNEQEGIDENVNGYSQNRQDGIDESDKEYLQNSQEGIVKNDKYINKIYNNNYNKIKDISNRYKTDQYDNVDWSKYYDN